LAVLATKAIMRHFFSWLILGLMGFTLVTACQYRSPQTISSSTELPATECRMVTHAMGETCVPLHPQRVVTLSLPTLGNTLALDITPIGTTNEVHQGNDSLTAVPGEPEKVTLIGISQPNLETLLQLKPDLIIGVDWFSSIYPTLSQIAPTVLDTLGYSTWDQHLSFLAKVLDKQDAEKAIWDRYYQRIKELKFALGDRYKDQKISFIYIGKGQINIDTQDSFAGFILDDAGLQRPDSQTVKTPYTTYTVSLEEIGKADGDVLFVTTFSNDGAKAFEEIRQDPLWQKLKAVQTNRVYPVDFMSWSAGHILGTDGVIDDLFKYLVNTP
jgi:iron complex transport system substrate-binding protein